VTAYTTGYGLTVGNRSFGNASTQQAKTGLAVGSAPNGGRHGYSGYYDGDFKIDGTTTLSSAPFAARVYLFPMDNPTTCLGMVYTDAAGTYSFRNLRTGRYLLMALDPSGAYEGVVHMLQDAVPQ
jgi:hypothetical protein